LLKTIINFDFINIVVSLKIANFKSWNFFEYLYYNLQLIDLQFIKKIIKKYQNIKTKKLTKEVNKIIQIFIKLLSYILI